MNNVLRIAVYLILACWLVGLFGFVKNISEISPERGTIFFTGFSLIVILIAIFEQVRVKRIQ